MLPKIIFEKIIKKYNANDQNFFNFVGGGLRQRVIRYYSFQSGSNNWDA